MGLRSQGTASDVVCAKCIVEVNINQGKTQISAVDAEGRNYLDTVV